MHSRCVIVTTRLQHTRATHVPRGRKLVTGDRHVREWEEVAAREPNNPERARRLRTCTRQSRPTTAEVSVHAAHVSVRVGRAPSTYLVGPPSDAWLLDLLFTTQAAALR